MTPDLALRLQRLAPAVRCQGREISLRPNSPELQARVLRTLLDAETPIISLNPRRNPLEDLYLSVVRGEPIAPIEEPPPNSLFAPPGHPDAVQPGRPGARDTLPLDQPSTGDTLLRELLGREDQRWRQADGDDET
jgi:ABC-2 type transport system ATP-binding protein